MLKSVILICHNLKYIPMFNVLIYPAGTEIGLEIARALKYQKDFQLFGANSVKDYSMFMYDKLHIVDNIVDNPDKALEQLQALVEKLDIDFLFPAHDEAIYQLSKSGKIKQAILPEKGTCGVCRSKTKTYHLFSDILNVPKFSSEYPVFCKPDKGQGSRGSFRADSEAELNTRIKEGDIIMEYLPGKEFTIDCFTDKNGALRFCMARERKVVSNGISVFSEFTDDSRFFEAAGKINENLKLQGQWFFQMKENGSGELYLLEIAPRSGGTSGLVRAAGVNLPLLTLYDRIGIDVTIPKPNSVNSVYRSLTSKYHFWDEFDRVYIDLEDTLVPVKPKLMALMYQFISQGKNIYIVTRFVGDVEWLLKTHGISRDLFRKIFQRFENKYDVIDPDFAIFIDDSFLERNEVASKLHIQVFDVQQAIDVLLND